MGRLDGKVALISGGAKGQGAVEGRMFVREGAAVVLGDVLDDEGKNCLLYTSPSPRDRQKSRMPSSA